MVYFKYNTFPKDLFRSTDKIKLPNIKSEEFLVWFLPNYQGDFRITFLNDLYKLYYDEFDYEEEKTRFFKSS